MTAGRSGAPPSVFLRAFAGPGGAREMFATSDGNRPDSFGSMAVHNLRK